LQIAISPLWLIPISAIILIDILFSLNN